jgi:hypothetical protein
VAKGFFHDRFIFESSLRLCSNELIASSLQNPFPMSAKRSFY